MKLAVKKYKRLAIGPEGGAFTCELHADGVLALPCPPENGRWLYRGMKREAPET